MEDKKVVAITDDELSDENLEGICKASGFASHQVNFQRFLYQRKGLVEELTEYCLI